MTTLRKNFLVFIHRRLLNRFWGRVSCSNKCSGCFVLFTTWWCFKFSPMLKWIGLYYRINIQKKNMCLMQWFTDLTDSWLEQSILMLLSLLCHYSVTWGQMNFGLYLEVEKALDIIYPWPFKCTFTWKGSSLLTWMAFEDVT